jgi:hypothetical protein
MVDPSSGNQIFESVHQEDWTKEEIAMMWDEQYYEEAAEKENEEDED